MCICTIWSRSLGLYSLYRKKDLHEIRDGVQKKYMTTKVADQHVHVHPGILSRIFPIITNISRKAVLSSTRHMHSVCTNDGMSEQRTDKSMKEKMN